MHYQEDASGLKLYHRPGDTPGGIFMLLWLFGWGYGTVAITRQVAADPDGRGFFAAGLMLVIAIAILVGAITKLFRVEELAVQGNLLTLTRRVIIPVRRRTVMLQRLQGIDLRAAPVSGPLVIGPRRNAPAPTSRRPPKYALEILTDDGQRILFGTGVLRGVLVEWGKRLRERVEKTRNRTLAPAPQLAAAEAQSRERTQQLLAETLAAVGARSEADLERDPELKRRAANYAMERMLRRAVTDDNWDQTASSRAPAAPQRPIEKAGSWVALGAWLVISAIWIFGTIGVAVRAIILRQWWAIFPLVPLIAFSLVLSIPLLATASMARDALRNAMRRVRR
jgi:hypothetical protein